MVFVIHPFMPILKDCDVELYAPFKEAVSGRILCNEIRVKIISSRVYFALLLFNILFIVYTTSYYIYRTRSAKWYTISTNTTTRSIADNHQYNISKQWQMYSLGKRGLFGSILGAFGHLVFTTFVLLYQVLVGSYTCEFYLWGPFIGFYIWTYAIIWRAYRLHLLIRVNELQQRYLSSTMISSPNLQHPRSNRLSPAAATATSTSLSTSTSSKRTAREDKDYIWFMRHKDTLNLSTGYQLFKFGGTLLVIAIVIIIVETTYIRPPHHGSTVHCKYMYGNIVNVAMVVGFFVLVVPFVAWYLRADKDAHGIRKEIMITMGVGAPCLIVSIIWQVIFNPPTMTSPAPIRGIFGPLNWLIVVTTTNHIASIIWPLFKKLSLSSSSRLSTTGERFSKNIKRKKKKRKRQTDQPTTTISRWYRNVRKTLFIHLEGTLDDPLYDGSRNTTATSMLPVYEQDRDDCSIELTTESLTQALSNPKMLRILQSWAVKDFSVENILFYIRYLAFARRIENKLASSLDLQPTSTKGQLSNEILNAPFDVDSIPELVEFYTTFIADQAPLQINISFAAREKIDAVFAPLIEKGRTLESNGSTRGINPSGIPSFLQSSPSSPSTKQKTPKWHQELQENIEDIPFAEKTSTTESKKSSRKQQQRLSWLLDSPSPVVYNDKPLDYILSPNSFTHDTHRLMPLYTTTLHTSTIMTTKTLCSDTNNCRTSTSSPRPTSTTNTNSASSLNVPIYILSRPASLISLEKVDSSKITLQLFEQARKEVFWNIFSGLFPKVVAAYHNDQLT